MENKKNRMYPERIENISCFRGCTNNCSYCAFKRTLWQSKCKDCQTFTPHAHLEVLNRTPKHTPNGKFSTIALNGDVCFATDDVFTSIIKFCEKWSDRTFLLQSKNPSCFVKYNFPDNVIIGTTIESNKDGLIHSDCVPMKTRLEAMIHIPNRRTITIEPVMEFDLVDFYQMIAKIEPYIIWIGYDSKPEKNHLPEPNFNKIKELIQLLRIDGFDVRTKDIRGNQIINTEDTPKPSTP